LKGLSKKQINEELHSRGIWPTTEKKVDLQAELTETLAGVQRIPAILFDEPERDIATLGLANYNVITVEPMHDCAANIQNLYDALPNCAPAAAKQQVLDLIRVCKGTKLTPRCKDMRASILKLLLSKDINTYGEIVCKVLTTMSELQGILYQPEIKRTPRLILRCYLVAFCHAKSCISLFGAKPKGENKLTARRLYGKYFHSLTIHAAQTLRVYNGKGCYAERQESCFGRLKGKF
jgi:hypothetical protein